MFRVFLLVSHSSIASIIFHNSNESESENGKSLSDHETSVDMIANVATREDFSHASKHMAVKHYDEFSNCGSGEKK